jgi:hypothetical protein
LSTPFSLRPKISLNVELSSSPLNSTQSTVFWSVRIFETESQPTFSGFPADNTFTYNIAGIAVQSTPQQFTYDFSPAGLQSITLASGSFTWNQAADGSGVTVSGSASVTSSLLGTANDSSSHTPAFIAPPTPVWSTGTSLSDAVRNRSVSRTVVASPRTSYQLISSSGATGLSLNTSTGVISGTPTVFGTASLTIRAFNYSSSADRTFTMVIQSTPPKVWTTSFVDGLLRVWNGSSWIRGRIRVWNGSAWIDSK